MQPLLAVLIVCLGALHPGSFSRSKIVVDGAQVQHSFRVQVLSLIEALPLDVDGDLHLDAAELSAAREPIVEYLAQHYTLSANGSTQAIPMQAGALDAFLDGTPDLPSSSWLQVELHGSWSAPIDELLLTETLFEDTAPAHIEYVLLSWAGQVPTELVLHGERNAYTFAASGEAARGMLPSFFVLGLEHILTGYDHLLFLLALLVAVRGWRSLAWVVTAFTLAHSVTLAAAAFELVSLPSQFVEMAIALSIVYVAIENLMGLERRHLWSEALVFGLLHGLGFAGFLKDALAGEGALFPALIGFNLGVEAGQIVAVLPLVLLFAGLARWRPTGNEPGTPRLLVPERLGKLLSLIVAFCGLYWFLERAGFLPL